MSSDSESEDDIQMKQFLEAADTTLLNNSMFQRQEKNIDELSATTEKKIDTEEATKKGMNSCCFTHIPRFSFYAQHQKIIGVYYICHI